MITTKPKCLFFTDIESLAPKGGPSAVCYYYMKEQQKRNTNDIAFLPVINQNGELHKRESRLNKILPNWLFNIYNDVKQIIKYNLFLGGHYPITPVDYSGCDIVFFHDIRDLYSRRFELEKYTGVVMLQSHTPQPAGHELYNNIPLRIRLFIPFLKKRLEIMDRSAFERADFIVFPCEDAEEPYYNDWPYYKTIHERKKNRYKYLMTGIPAAYPRRKKSEVFSELGLPLSSFVVSYVGRHNKVKGYGDLKRMGELYLKSDKNAWFVCAGKEEPMKRLEHDRWIEIGWTNDAHSYISASDVFVLPNKETYFDIVMLEVLSLGKIVIASRTGGNKYFEKAGCKGVLLYNTVDEAVDLIKRVKSMTEEERKDLGVSNRMFYESHNTVEKMYDRFTEVIKEICQENNI